MKRVNGMRCQMELVGVLTREIPTRLVEVSRVRGEVELLGPVLLEPGLVTPGLLEPRLIRPGLLAPGGGRRRSGAEVEIQVRGGADDG